MNQPRWTGREGDWVLGESTAVRNLMPGTAVMPDTRCASQFVRSLAEPRVAVCTYLIPSSWALDTWPSMEAKCAFARCIELWSSLKGRQFEDLKVGKKKTKGRGVLQTERKEGAFRSESGREFGVPVTWLECRSSHPNGCVIRSGADTEDFLLLYCSCTRPSPQFTFS